MSANNQLPQQGLANYRIIVLFVNARMKKSLKIILVLLLVMVIILSAALLASWYYITPERLRAIAESTISEKLGKKVVIRDIHINLFDNPYVTASGIELGNRDEIFFKADAITARFSKWRILFGGDGIKSVDLANPFIIVHTDKIKRNEKTPELPLIRTDNAKCIIYHKNMTIKIDNINGYISSYLANLNADALGGKINFTALESAGSWKGKAILNNLNLAILDKSLTGYSDGSVSFQTEKDDITGKASVGFRQLGLPGGIRSDIVNLDARIEKKGDKYSCDSRLGLTGFGLPWGARVDRIDMKSQINTDMKDIVVKELQIQSSIINFAGSAAIKGIDKKRDMLLDLNMNSEEFGYEQFVDFLPVKEFPGWLYELLKKQARKGKAQIRHASFRGTVNDFYSYNTCIKDLDISLAINGLTFSSRPGNIVKNIKADLITKDGDIDVLNIRGSAGESELKSVTLRFPATHKDDFRIGVEADLDMKAADFIQAWRAGVTAMNVNTFLDPINQIKDGRISAKAGVFYEKSTGGARVQGNAVLTNVDLNWDKAVIRDLSGTLKGPEYFKPLIVGVKGSYNDMPVDRLNMNIMDPFGRLRFTYDLKIRGIPGSKAFSLDKDTTVTASGNGTWPDLGGSLNVESRDFTVYGTQIKPRTGSISGSGAFSARIGSGSFIDVPELDTVLGETNLKTKIHISDDYSSFSLAGKLDLSMFDILKKGDFIPCSGITSGDFSIRLGEKADYFGRLNLNNVQIEHDGTKTTIDGDMTMDKKNIGLKHIKVIHAEINAMLNGTLTLNDIPEFKGDVAFNDLEINNAGEPSTSFNKIKVDARFNFTNLTFYGIKIPQASTMVQLEKGVLKLLGMDLKTPYGSVSGSAMIPPEGSKTYDLNINIDNTPIVDALKIISKNKPWITGSMSMHGRLWNTGDAVNGDIQFRATNGIIDRYDLVSTIFSVLNPYKIIKTGEFDLTKVGFPYNHISANFTIRDSFVTFDDFYLDSNSLQVSSVGKYMLRTNYMDVIMGIQPLETFDKTVGMIPIVGWVLTGDKGTLIIISLKVRGPVDDPSVKYLPAASISNPVAKSLLRVLNLPIDLLTRPEEVILPGMNKESRKEQ
jgi:hypothetical protein